MDRETTTFRGAARQSWTRALPSSPAVAGTRARYAAGARYTPPPRAGVQRSRCALLCGGRRASQQLEWFSRTRERVAHAVYSTTRRGTSAYSHSALSRIFIFCLSASFKTLALTSDISESVGAGVGVIATISRVSDCAELCTAARAPMSHPVPVVTAVGSRRRA